MPRPYTSALRFQRGCHIIRRQIRAADHEAAPQQDARDRGQAGAADADQMNMLPGPQLQHDLDDDHDYRQQYEDGD